MKKKKSPLISFESHEYDHMGVGREIVHIQSEIGQNNQTACGIDLEDSDFTQFILEDDKKLNCHHCIEKIKNIILEAKRLKKFI